MGTGGPFIYTVPDSQLFIALNYKQHRASVERNQAPVSPIMLGVKLNPDLADYGSAPLTSITKSYSGYIIADSSDAILIAAGITGDNIKDYEYHIVENDSIEVVPWSPIPRLEQNYGADRPYGFIGKFNAPGKQLLVEVKNKHNYGIRDGIVFDWRVNYKPVVTEIMVNLVPNGTNRIDYFNLNFIKMNKGYATRFDKAGMPLNFKFPVDSVENIRLSFKSHPTVPYSIYLTKDINGKRDTTLLEVYLLNNFLGNYLDIASNNFNKSGKYQFIIQRNSELNYWGEDQKLRIPFEVLSPPTAEKKILLKQLMPYIVGALVLIGLLFWLYRRQANIKLARSVQAKQNVNLKMRSIRAQLNPHFMFNALTSIQNLVNKKDMEGANHYLSRFASLTRKVLNTGERELISLEDELKILDDYLQMEQLRFGFRYRIEADAQINQANTEVPAMLLQPFVENAVKHGVSDLRDRGEVVVAVRKENKNLRLIITDNGIGFQPKAEAQNGNSFGLKLSEERIELLNQLYTGSPFSLSIDSDADGTMVVITLTDWIS
ncbi:hypothetical protein GCM10022392_12230 [Mucilaginibacter panaciglaebae]|uniref:Histidine kinase domain-containing protein n=2 Tax=Mucilaginibacter panaciglaebae TaxID=502331 RepID=A0ABP7WNS5_9SPHI